MRGGATEVRCGSFASKAAEVVTLCTSAAVRKADVTHTVTSSACRAVPSSRAHVDLVAAAAALAAFHPAFEPRHFGLGRIARHVNQCLMAAGVVEAGGEQVLHTLVAHAEPFIGPLAKPASSGVGIGSRHPCNRVPGPPCCLSRFHLGRACWRASSADRAGAWASWWSHQKLWPTDVFEKPELDQLISVTLVAKSEPGSSCHSVSHGLLLSLPLVSGKREPLTNDSSLRVGLNHGVLFRYARRAGDGPDPRNVSARAGDRYLLWHLLSFQGMVGTGGLKIAAENSVTEAQWVGGGNGLGAQRYRWHKRPAFFQGQRPCYGTPYGYSGLLQLWSVRSAPYHAAVVVWPDSLTGACHCRSARTKDV